MSQVTVRNRNKNTDKKPNWEYRFEAAKIDGKRKQLSKSGFRTKKEALEAGNKALAEYNNSGVHIEPSDISVADYMDYYFEQYVKVNLKYNTQLNKLQIIENRIKPNFGQYKLKALNPSVLQEYANTLKLDGLRKSSIEAILSTISGALDYAVYPLQYISTNPMKFVSIPKIEKKSKERIIVRNEEWKCITDRFRGTRFYIILMIGYYTGMRIGEVCGLIWDDIDLDNRIIHVRRQIVKRNYGVDIREVYKVKGKKEEKSSWYFGTLKTSSSERDIRFGDSLYNILREERERQLANEGLYGDYFVVHVMKPETDEKNNVIYRLIPVQKCINSSLPRAQLVCISENGEYTSSDSFKYCSRVIHYELGIAFDFHSLRHTHATKLVEADVNIKTVQKRLGHGNVETTINTYVHDTEAMQASAVEVFERLSL